MNNKKFSAYLDKQDKPRVFWPSLYVKKFIEKPIRSLQINGQELLCRQFQAGEEIDLQVWIDSEGDIIRQEVFFYGAIIEWTLEVGVKTGVLVENENSQLETEVEIFYDPQINKNIIHQFMGFLSQSDYKDSILLTRVVENFLNYDKGFIQKLKNLLRFISKFLIKKN